MSDSKWVSKGVFCPPISPMNGDFFSSLVSESPIAMYSCDRNGYVTYYNKAAAALWGREPAIGHDLWCGSWKIYYPDGRPMPLDECPMAKVLKQERPYESDTIKIERPDKSQRTVLVFPKPIFDAESNIQGAYNTLVDITDKQTVESRQAFFTAIIESSDDAIVSKDLSGIITSWNSGAERIFGFTAREAIGQPITIIIPSQRLKEEDLILSSIRQGNKIDHFETIRVHKSGKEVPISITVSPIKDREGNILGASKIARDISDRLNAEKTIEEYNRELKILNAVGESISERLDTGTILQRVTDATTKITGAAFGAFFFHGVDEGGETYKLYAFSGISRQESESLDMTRNSRLFHSTISDSKIVRSDDITKDKRYGENPLDFRMPAGYLPVKSYLAVPVVSHSGQVLGGLFFGHSDPAVFQQKDEHMVASIASQASVALENARLFEEVASFSAKKDEFIALASHELRTPLTTIRGYLQILARKDVPDPTSFIKKCLGQVERLYSLVEELLDVSRIEAGKLQLNPEIFDFRQLLVDVIENFRITTKSHQIYFHDFAGTVMIKGDRYRLEQGLINLLTNAVKYSPGTTAVQVTLEKKGMEVKISIRDEGIGLTTEQQKRIFDRFYRAEHNTNVSGLGLGLYLTKEIVARHDGKIGVISSPGEGSEFYFLLPLE